MKVDIKRGFFSFAGKEIFFSVRIKPSMTNTFRKVFFLRSNDV
jgi:hypothetical protein